MNLLFCPFCVWGFVSITQRGSKLSYIVTNFYHLECFFEIRKQKIVVKNKCSFFCKTSINNSRFAGYDWYTDYYWRLCQNIPNKNCIRFITAQFGDIKKQPLVNKITWFDLIFILFYVITIDFSFWRPLQSDLWHF